jgi:integrase
MKKRRKRDGLYRRDGVFAFRYKDVSGVWREKYTGTKDRVQAKAFKDAFEQDLKDGTLPTEIADWKLDEAERWWKEFRRPRISEATLNSEKYRLQHLPRIIGNKRLHEIKNCDLDNYITARLNEGMNPWSINKEVMLWRMILKKAKLWRRLADDYQALKTHASDIGIALTREQLHNLAEAAAMNEDWKAAFYGSVLAANTGLRGGEIKKLKISAVDLEKRQLRVKRADAKTDASARFIELNRDATEAASRLVTRANLLGATGPDDFLMPKCLSNVSHGPQKGLRGYSPKQHQVYWDTAWKSLTEEAGLSGLRFHDLRHTFITQMVERGVPLGVIQTFVGHISTRMVRHYTHISTGAAKEAVAKLDADPILGTAMTVQEPRVTPTVQ